MLTKRLQEITDGLISKNKDIKVYASTSKGEFENTYMFVTDGKTVLYLQDDGGFYGVSVCLEYKPDRHNGSGCRIAEEDVLNGKSIITAEMIADFLEEFTNEMTLKTVHKYNKFIKDCVKFYKDADEWYEQLWRKDDYEIIK